ncbi:MAG TPA: alpha/beta hydrolase [Acidimicrobiales bacterium]|jgi:pimeloyl-ACP methyl ester carboxylesterase|nr:alpha/beta hydrolase [Acidimicrobiales bacterium]
MEGTRYSVAGADGVDIGLLSAGAGSALLLVHGGMGRIEQWGPIWSALAERWQVTAMDRRGRGSSGDSDPYLMAKEFDDIAAVANSLAERQGAPVDVFAHSYGATCTLGAAAQRAPFRRVALYEPPGPQTAPSEWVERVTALIAEGKPGRAMFSFVTEIVGLSAERFEEYRSALGAYDVLPIVDGTLPREAKALRSVNLTSLAPEVTTPVLLLLGTKSPPWASDITRALAASMLNASIVSLVGQGHDAIDTAPELVVGELKCFLEGD